MSVNEINKMGGARRKERKRYREEEARADEVIPAGPYGFPVCRMIIEEHNPYPVEYKNVFLPCMIK